MWFAKLVSILSGALVAAVCIFLLKAWDRRRRILRRLSMDI